VIEAAITKFGRLDVVLSVAGISMAARFEEILPGSKVFEQLMNTNYWGPVNLTKYALPHLIESKGRIGVVTSGAAVLPFATRTGYCASKYACLGFFEALRWEVGPRHDIHITTVVPALTSGTGINKTRLGFDGTVTTRGNFPPDQGMSKEKCVRTILSAIANRKRDVTFDMGFWAFMRQIFPDSVEYLINLGSEKMMNNEFPLYEKPQSQK
jgi:dehydrogenase/reductase SDR family member 7B